MKRREIIEFEVGKMEFGGTSSTIIGKRNVNMKGGITGQKVKASVKKANSQKADVKLLEVPFTFEIIGFMLSVVTSGIETVFISPSSNLRASIYFIVKNSS